ncbi:hypothetical protein M011DRAFT_60082 [Sporormia fimetaria CBS 119925]|uniref:Uncharacterized protein n=1 Tax=Sporormia fimetaria CBS 119925 TaxID=1340428 RepID=A0A6A6VCU6_9PLEO|nr:hypothetical protein M011DRAFT_60082 [Sporormia fimetaria CBS 119925]
MRGAEISAEQYTTPGNSPIRRAPKVQLSRIRSAVIVHGCLAVTSVPIGRTPGAPLPVLTRQSPSLQGTKTQPAKPSRLSPPQRIFSRLLTGRRATTPALTVRSLPRNTPNKIPAAGPPASPCASQFCTVALRPLPVCPLSPAQQCPARLSPHTTASSPPPGSTAVFAEAGPSDSAHHRHRTFAPASLFQASPVRRLTAWLRHFWIRNPPPPSPPWQFPEYRAEPECRSTVRPCLPPLSLCFATISI